MKNKVIVFIILAAIFVLGQSCEQDPSFEFRDDGKIYFKYPKKENSLGIETNILVDSITYSLHGKQLQDGKDTLWVKVQIMGARQDVERQYKVVAIADSSSGKEGLDFDRLADFYVVHRNVGVDSFPLVLNKAAFEKVFSRNVLLQLQSTEDLCIAFVEYASIKVNFSAYLLEPEWWWTFSLLLGDYHPLKYDKVVEIYGSKDVDPYGNNPYCNYVGNIVREWFENNVVIDPFTDERLVL